MHVEKKDLCLGAGDDVGLGEVDDCPAIDHEEEADLVVGECIGDALAEVGVLGDGEDLVLDVLAAEELLSGAGRTERIFSVHSESMSSPQKMTIDT
jgi:hypothetical protein